MKIGAETYSSAITQAVNYTHWVIDAFADYIGDHLLEVGLGHGSYRAFLPPLKGYVGIDIDEAAIETASARYPHDTFLCADVADPCLIDCLVGTPIDTVLCANVLEHIEDDKAAVRVLLALLREGGHLLLFVPALPLLYGEMDRLAGHHRRYTKHSLAALVPPNKGRVLVNRYFNPVGALGWWVNGLLPHRSLNSNAINGQISLFDRYVLPVSRLIDPLTRSFFGQSIACVVQKQ